jgi:hypothetical protein
MFQLPDVPFNEYHSFIFASGAVILGAIFIGRLIKSEVCRRRCDLCGARVPPDEHAHHVTVCALKLMLVREIQLREEQRLARGG